MATNWLSNLFGGSSTTSVGMPGGSATYRAPTTTTTRTTSTTSSTNAYADRMAALARFYSENSYRAMTGPGAWRRPTSAELAGMAPRTGYASPYNRTQQEYLVGQNLRALNNFMPGTGMSNEEWIRRQRAAPIGYTYTPYAGWVQTPSASGANNQPGGDYGGGYAGGGGYGSGGGSGTGSAGSLPDWYQSFLSQMNWRI